MTAILRAATGVKPSTQKAGSLAFDLPRANKDHRVSADQHFVVGSDDPSFQYSVANRQRRFFGDQQHAASAEHPADHKSDEQNSHSGHGVSDCKGHAARDYWDFKEIRIRTWQFLPCCGEVLVADSAYRGGNGGLQIAHGECFVMASVNRIGVPAVRVNSGQSAR